MGWFVIHFIALAKIISFVLTYHSSLHYRMFGNNNVVRSLVHSFAATNPLIRKKGGAWACQVEAAYSVWAPMKMELVKIMAPMKVENNEDSTRDLKLDSRWNAGLRAWSRINNGFDI